MSKIPRLSSILMSYFGLSFPFGVSPNILKPTYGCDHLFVRNRTEVDWTFICDDRTFVIPENFRRFVMRRNLDAKNPTAVGKRESKFSLLSLLIPFLQREYFDLNAGVAVSREAVNLILSNVGKTKCSGLFFPGSAVNGFARCCSKLKILQLHGQDPNGGQYFLTESPKLLIPESSVYGIQNGRSGFFSLGIFRSENVSGALLMEHQDVAT